MVNVNINMGHLPALQDCLTLPVFLRTRKTMDYEQTTKVYKGISYFVRFVSVQGVKLRKPKAN